LITNETGIYKIKIGKKYFPFITQQNGQFSHQQPVIDKNFWAAVEATEKLFLRSLRRFHVDFTNPPDAQRRRLADEPAQEEEEAEEVVVVEVEDELVVDPFLFWSSPPDARKLFGAQETDQDASVTLRQKIETHQSSMNW